MSGAPTSIERATEALRATLGDRVRTEFPLAPLTTFRIGGPAALFFEPESREDLTAVATALVQAPIPVVILGKGSNVLVSDDGFEGLVLRLGRGFRFASRDGDQIAAGGSMPLPALAGIAAQHGLGGLEFGAAIPASLGGAVRMNAGAHNHAIGEVVETIEVFSLTTGQPSIVDAVDAGFVYRDTAIDGVVISAMLQLHPEDRDVVRERMDEARRWRKKTQPLAEPNCGSVFKNPPGEAAARVVDAAGGKEIAVGGAQVSAKHANFIVAAPGTRAEDVVAVIRAVQDRVEAATGIVLEPEVQLIGGFAQAPR